MEYHLKKQSVPAPRMLLDTVSEQPVDIDLTLPDYCPDIERILKCSLCPEIYLQNVSGDRLTVEGSAVVRIVYLDGGGCARSYEYKSPFSVGFTLKDSPEDCAAYVDTKPEYMNCRAVSPRKLSLHGAFSLYARVVVSSPTDFCMYDDDDDLQVDRQELSVSALGGLCCDVFTAREDISLKGRPDMSSMITHRLSVRVTDLKAVGGKMMLSAEGRLELLYLSAAEGGGLQTLSCSFPISHIVDCAGADDDSVIDSALDVMSYELRLSDDALSGSDVLSVEAKLRFNALCYEERPISVIRDAFSTKRDITARYEPVSCACDTRCLRVSDIAKSEIHIGDEAIGKVIDVYTERAAVSASVSGGAVMLNSKITVGVLYENADGETRLIDRDIDLSYNPSQDDIDSVESVRLSVESLSYRIVDEHTIELRAETVYTMLVSRRVSCSSLVSVSADDDAPERAADGTLILYYADRGERIWDISKRFCSRPGDIISENELEGDTLTDGIMLLIPSA